MEDVDYEMSTLPRYARSTVLLATRHLRDVLTAKGYWLCYHEYNGDHQPVNWRGTFGEALAALSSSRTAVATAPRAIAACDPPR